MKKSLIVIIGAALFAAWISLCSAQSDAPYTEGTVWGITMVKTKYGMGDQIPQRTRQDLQRLAR